jgi:hypothetical protein
MLELQLLTFCLRMLYGSDGYPVKSAAQKLADHLRVQSMAGFMRHNVADDWHPHERQITDEVEDLVTHEFILVPEPFFVYH